MESDAALATHRPVLPLGVQLTGDLDETQDLQVSGILHGNIAAKGCVRVSPGGVVRGDVLANLVIVHGRVTGNVFATAEITVAADGSVQGDLAAPQIVVAGEHGVRRNQADKVGTSNSSGAKMAQAAFPPLARVQVRNRS